MAQESSEIRVNATGSVYVAPVGTAFPTNISAAVSPLAGWVELGYLTEEGPRLSFGRESTDLLAWQSADAVRVLTTSRPKSISFDLMQHNRHTLMLALGGGTVTEPTPGNFLFTPADDAEIYQRALIVELEDGEFNYRYCFSKTEQDGAVEFAAVRTNSTNFAMSMKVLAPDTGTSYIVQSDDPNLSLLEAGS